MAIRASSGVARSLNALLGSEQRRIRRYRDTLGNLAHSLKTPLAVIRTAAAGDASQRAGINREIDRMAQIVDRQLQRAAMSGGTTLGQPAVPVLPVISELRAAMRKVHAHKDLVIEVDVAQSAAFVGDRGDLLELLGNLIDNACKWCRGRYECGRDGLGTAAGPKPKGHGAMALALHRTEACFPTGWC